MSRLANRLLTTADPGGSASTIVVTGVSVVIALLTSFGVFRFSQDEVTAVTSLTVFAAGTGALVYAWLHSWKTQTYDVGLVTSALTTGVSLLLAVLTAFNVFHATGAQQASVTAATGIVAAAGAYVFHWLTAARQVQLQRTQGTRK